MTANKGTSHRDFRIKICTVFLELIYIKFIFMLIESASDEVHIITYGYPRANGFSFLSKKKK